MNLEKWHSQLRKGTLEFMILLILKKNDFYGYELLKQIRRTLDLETSEGTIYPILTRLKKSGLVSDRWEHPETGIPRKYYSITQKGNETLDSMKSEWQDFAKSIEKLMRN